MIRGVRIVALPSFEIRRTSLLRRLKREGFFIGFRKVYDALVLYKPKAVLQMT